jgi:hypothetical protein
MYGGQVFTERLHRDGAYLDRVAEVIFQRTPEIFRVKAADWLAAGLGGGRGPHVLSPASLRFE